MTVTLTFACDRCPRAASYDLTAGDYFGPMSALGQIDSARTVGFRVLLCDACAEREGLGDGHQEVELPDGVTFRAAVA